uniref:tRNA glutamyl-Q(34) synthetase GluQRS n=1 Tax=Ningiella ruwaisensis TaxID=2364274 RepID=UPI0014462B7F|nr:tRNA glutamyl-Q(34) synthetase GluQRS [Ningiella ruwaisensis]
MQSNYVGRFAPSPSGPLHFGSLICALASYLHAKQHQGKWLVRIEDIDTPRIDTKYSQMILDSLRAHGMQWDDEVLYQSQRHAIYEDVLADLHYKKQLYACECSRRQIRERTPPAAQYYDQHCREKGLGFENKAIRWKNNAHRQMFDDLHYGRVTVEDKFAFEDPVLKRADGIYAYHLAVIADDIAQGVNFIVRGSDLLDLSPLHLSLFEAFRYPVPQFFHIPVAASEAGQKLSKQHHAPAIKNELALSNLKSALHFLACEHRDIDQIDDAETLLSWAISHFSFDNISAKREILVSRINDVYCLSRENKK